LTVLGFVAFTFFTVQLLDSHVTHKSIYTHLRPVFLIGTEWENELEGTVALKEELENIHFMVFFMMIHFVFRISNALPLCKALGDQWKRLEMTAEIAKEDQEFPPPSFRPSWLSFGAARHEYQYTRALHLSFHIFRDEFINPTDVRHARLPPDFPVAEYLHRSMIDLLIELSELTLANWLWFLFVLSGCSYLFFTLSKEGRIALALVLPCLKVAVLGVARAYYKAVFYRLYPRHISQQEDPDPDPEALRQEFLAGLPKLEAAATRPRGNPQMALFPLGIHADAFFLPRFVQFVFHVSGYNFALVIFYVLNHDADWATASESVLAVAFFLIGYGIELKLLYSILTSYTIATSTHMFRKLDIVEKILEDRNIARKQADRDREIAARIRGKQATNGNDSGDAQAASLEEYEEFCELVNSLGFNSHVPHHPPMSNSLHAYSQDMLDSVGKSEHWKGAGVEEKAAFYVKMLEEHRATDDASLGHYASRCSRLQSPAKDAIVKVTTEVPPCGTNDSRACGACLGWQEADVPKTVEPRSLITLGLKDSHSDGVGVPGVEVDVQEGAQAIAIK